jgi:hypothetical protein
MSREANGFNPRSAIRSRAETMAQRQADTQGKPAIVYEVNGGYEVRAADAAPPRNAHVPLITIQPAAAVAAMADDPDAPQRPPKGKGKGGRS